MTVIDPGCGVTVEEDGVATLEYPSGAHASNSRGCIHGSTTHPAACLLEA